MCRQPLPSWRFCMKSCRGLLRAHGAAALLKTLIFEFRSNSRRGGAATAPWLRTRRSADTRVLGVDDSDARPWPPAF